MAPTLDDGDDCGLRALIDEIWLGKDSESSLASNVQFLGHLKNLLSSDVHISRDDREDNGARVSHVSSHPSSLRSQHAVSKMEFES